MSQEPKMKVESISQICLVVKDLDKAMKAYWEILGIGPWTVWTYGPEVVKDTTYRGRPEGHRFRVAHARVGEMMLELIQPLEGDTIYKDFMERAGEGVQHLGIGVENLAEAVEKARAAGFQVIQSGRGQGLEGDGAFAYLGTEEELGTVFELSQRPAKRRPPERTYP